MKESVIKAQLSGKLAERLSQQPARSTLAGQVTLKSHSEPFVVDDMSSKAVLAMSLLLTSHLVQHAQSSFSQTSLFELRDKLLSGFSAGDNVSIEVEVYELLNWFAVAIDPDWDVRTGEPRDEASLAHEHSQTDALERAIREKRELFMHYYSGGRGEFTQRRIKPLQITAEKYLIAFCYLRNEERVFRLSRIVALRDLDPDTGQVLPSPEELLKSGTQGMSDTESIADSALSLAGHKPVAAIATGSKELAPSRAKLIAEAAFQYDEVDERGMTKMKTKKTKKKTAKDKPIKQALLPGMD